MSIGNKISLVGEVVGTVEGALRILGGDGERDVKVTPESGHALIEVKGPNPAAALASLKPILDYKSGKGTLTEALRGLCSHLDADKLGPALAGFDELLAAFENDGRLTFDELPKIFARVMAELRA